MLEGLDLLMKEDGTVWTLTVNKGSVGTGDERISNFSAQPHRQVRSTGKELQKPLYVCMHTKASYAELADAMAHSQCDVEK